MAHIQPVVRCEIDPTKPVQEVCAVIMAIMPYHPGQEEAILQGIKDAVEQRLVQLKGAETKHGEPLRKPGRDQKDQ